MKSIIIIIFVYILFVIRNITNIFSINYKIPFVVYAKQTDKIARTLAVITVYLLAYFIYKLIKFIL